MPTRRRKNGRPVISSEEEDCQVLESPRSPPANDPDSTRDEIPPRLNPQDLTEPPESLSRFVARLNDDSAASPLAVPLPSSNQGSTSKSQSDRNGESRPEESAGSLNVEKDQVLQPPSGSAAPSPGLINSEEKDNDEVARKRRKVIEALQRQLAELQEQEFGIPRNAAPGNGSEGTSNLSQNFSATSDKTSTDIAKIFITEPQAANEKENTPNQNQAQSGSAAQPVLVPHVEPPPAAPAPRTSTIATQAASTQPSRPAQAASKSAAAPPAKNVSNSTDKQPGRQRPPSLQEQMEAAVQRMAAQNPARVVHAMPSKDALPVSASSQVKANSHSSDTQNALAPIAPAAKESIAIPRIKPGVMPTSHHGRVSHLLRAGWQYDDVIAALEASMDEKGEENIDHAQDSLENLRLYRLECINKLARPKTPEPEEEPEERIKAGSDVALYIATHLDDLEAVLAIMDVHEASRASHSADEARCIANLMASQKVKVAGRKLDSFSLKKIVSAIVHDCDKCKALRERDKKEKQEAIEKADKLAKQKEEAAKRRAQAEAARESREAEEQKKRQAAEAKRARTPPLPDNDNDLVNFGINDGEFAEDFDPQDSQWCQKKRRGVCWECGEGDLGGDKSVLNPCEVCSHLYHKDCTKWARIKHAVTAQVKWACKPCFQRPPARWAIMGAANSTPTNDSPRNDTALVTPHQQNAARTLFPNRGGSGGGGDDGGDGGGDGGGGGDASTPHSARQSDHRQDQNKNETSLTLQVKSYVQWEPLPPGHPLGVEHATKGFGKTAYSNWIKTNISLRDQTKRKLGLLAANALTNEMRTSIGNALLLGGDEFRPRPNMTGAEVSQWVASDIDYNWVKKVSDEALKKHLDKSFSVCDEEPFLALRFPSDLPHIHPDGSVNYMAASHSAFAELWLNSLTELRHAKWDESTTDLRQAYITALEPVPTLYDQALRYKTDSHDLLISYMRQWTMYNESRQLSEKNRKVQIAKAVVAAGGTLPTQALQSTPAKEPLEKKKTGDHKEVKALRTEIAKLQSQLNQQSPTSSPIKGTKYFCNGCGYDYTRDHRNIPCEPNCVFEEHADHNTGYKTGTLWPSGKKRLFWGTPEEYLKKHGKDMPEKGKAYIEMKRNAKKRDRDNRSYRS